MLVNWLSKMLDVTARQNEWMHLDTAVKNNKLSAKPHYVALPQSAYSLIYRLTAIYKA